MAYTAACRISSPLQKRDNTTRFKVELSSPNRRTFVQGSQVNITTTVRRLINTTQGATYISLRPRSDLRRTWAAGFAHTDAQRAALSGETEQTLFGHDWSFDRYSRMLMAQPVRSSAEEQRDLERGDDFMFRHFRSWRSASRDEQYGAVLDPALDAQTVEVNLTMCVLFILSARNQSFDSPQFSRLVQPPGYDANNRSDLQEVPVNTGHHAPH